MSSKLDEFSAMFISARPVHGEKKFLFIKGQVGWDCTFRYYPEGPRMMFRVARENPLAGGLQPTMIYQFKRIADPNSAPKSDIVTEIRTMKPYEIKD